MALVTKVVDGKLVVIEIIEAPLNISNLEYDVSELEIRKQNIQDEIDALTSKINEIKELTK